MPPFPEALDAGFNTASPYAQKFGFTRTRVFDALATFPEPPSEYVPQLAEMALSTSEQLRSGAQRVLSKHPDRLNLALDGLTDSRASTRAQAAFWLARLKDVATLKPLEAAFKKGEKRRRPQHHSRRSGDTGRARRALSRPRPVGKDRPGMAEKEIRA